LHQLYAIEHLAQEILANPEHEGVTFSGGEPFWQAAGLADLARRVKKAGLNVMAFSGFRLQELQSVQAPPAAAELLGELDVLVDGPFLESQAIHDPHSLVSSRNQQVHCFNSTLQDRMQWASDQMEIHILPDGTRLFTGYWGGHERLGLAL
jgi:anaerobic ribonucleoside-triphosphate reductase activating protein